MRKKLNKTLHVVPYHCTLWAIMQEGNNTPLNVFEDPDVAIDIGKRRAERTHTAVVIHNEDGTVKERVTYRKYRRQRRCKATRKPKQPVRCDPSKEFPVCNLAWLARRVKMSCDEYLENFY